MLSGNELLTCDFVAVDLETTGCRPGRNSIIEIGAVRFNASGTIATLERLVRPEDVIPRAVEDLTGISNGMVATGPDIADVMAEFRDFADGAVLVAHNYRFDLSFLDYESERIWDTALHRPVIDTLSILRRLRPDLKRYSLGSLAAEYQLETAPDHRAGNDARATAELLRAVLPALSELGMHTAGDLVAFSGLSGQQVLADRLHLTRGIPDEPGVYLFRDAEGRVIYVGHARSLRTRTRQYFYPGATTDGLAHDVASITAVRTFSQLDALLLEHRLVDRHRPRYNPSAHQSRAGYLIKIDTGTDFPGLKVVEVPRTRGRLIGPFTSKWAATTLLERLQTLYGLRRCARRLDAQLAMTACTCRDDDSCPAPCVRKSDPAAYAEAIERAARVLDDPKDFHQRMSRAQRSAAATGHYEEAIRNRDGLRALERALTTVAMIREAASRSAVLVEESDGEAVVSFIRGGLRAAVLRGTRESIDTKLEAVVERVYFSGSEPVDPLRLSPEKIAELIIIASVEDSSSHLEVPVGTQADTISRVRRALGLDRRVPRRRHEATSGA